MSTITSANSSLNLAIRSAAGIIVGPFNVEGYASDDAFAVEPVQSAQALMGVDGKMSAGFTPFMTPQTIILQADSPSVALFEEWVNAQQVLKDALYAEGWLTLPSIGRTYALHKGALTRHTSIPAAKAILQPLQFEITWELVQPTPLVL